MRVRLCIVDWKQRVSQRPVCARLGVAMDEFGLWTRDQGSEASEHESRILLSH